MTTKPTCPQCIGEGADSPRPVHTRGLCRRHYDRAIEDGSLAKTYTKRGNPTQCTECAKTGVTKPVKAKGLCNSHYMTVFHQNSPECSFPGCTGLVQARDLCGGHYRQVLDGRPLAELAEYKPRGLPCEVKGCPRSGMHAGLCERHYQRRMEGYEDWAAPIRPKAPDGEGHLNEQGYRIITVDGVTMLEHRWVMEQHIGRPLLPTETVHHLSGGFKGRSDNRIEHLQLWTGRHPKGHRIDDVVAYSREMLAVYGDEAERARYVESAAAVLEDMTVAEVEA